MSTPSPRKTSIKVDSWRQDIVFAADLSGQHLSFHSTWGLFSPREIDEGSRLLLKYLQVSSDDTCLDIGCGYGPIGLWLAKVATDGMVHMIDKDFVAIEYAQKNITLNRLTNATAYLSNGFSHIPADLRFDTIVSNVPAKVGRELLSILLHDARKSLKPGGQLVVVTINGLREFIKNNFKDVFGNYKKIKQGRAYTVARAVN